MVEWFMALVLKTSVPKGTVGSNPTSSVFITLYIFMIIFGSYLYEFVYLFLFSFVSVVCSFFLLNNYIEEFIFILTKNIQPILKMYNVENICTNVYELFSISISISTIFTICVLLLLLFLNFILFIYNALYKREQKKLKNLIIFILFFILFFCLIVNEQIIPLLTKFFISFGKDNMFGYMHVSMKIQLQNYLLYIIYTWIIIFFVSLLFCLIFILLRFELINYDIVYNNRIMLYIIFYVSVYTFFSIDLISVLVIEFLIIIFLESLLLVHIIFVIYEKL